MNDQDKTREQLIAENEALRQRMAAMESVEAERSRAEEELRRSEAKWRSVAENAPLFLAIVDQSGKMDFLNRFQPGFAPENVFGRPVYDFLQPQSHAVARKCLEHVFQTGEGTSYESVGAGPEGSLCDYLTDVGPVIVEGKIIAATLMTRDITDRKRVEATLEAKTTLLEGIMESTDSPIFSVDRNYCYTGFNGSHATTMKSIYGAEIELGKSILEYHTVPEDRSKAKACLDRTLAGERFVVEGDAGEVVLSRLCFEITHGPIKSINGEVVGAAVYVQNITKRKRAEDALRESEERFRSLFHDSSVGSVVVTPSGQFIQVNRAFCEFLGYSEQELVGKTVLSVTHPDDQEESSKAIHQAAHSGPRIKRLEKRYLHKSGRVVWGEASSALICDVAGEPDYFVTQVLDITERKRANHELQKAHNELERRVRERTAELEEANERLLAEVGQRRQADEALRQSEAKYRALVESSPDAVAMIDLQGRIVFASQRTAEQHGAFHPDELLGKQVTDLVVEEDRDRLRGNTTRLLEEGVRRNHQYRGIRKDGTRFDAEASSAVIRDAAGNPAALMVIYRDITERKQAEEELAIFRRFVEAATQGFGMTDLDGRIIYVNPMMARWLGEEKPEDAFGKKASTYHTSEFPRNLDELILPALRRDGYWQGELPLVSRNGTAIPTLYNIFPMLDKSGDIYRHAAVVTDITELKRAEEALRQSHDELRAIYDGMPDGLLVADIETKKFVRCNASMRRMLGYSEEELLSRSVMDIHPADEVPSVLRTFHTLVDGSLRIAQDIPVLRKDGDVFHADITHNEITLNGRHCTVGFFRDITERRQAQEALRQSYDELRILHDGAVDGLAVYDIERLRSVQVNAALCQMLGYSEEELKTLAPEQLHPLDDFPKIRAHFEAVLERREFRYDALPCRRKDGVVTYCDTVARHISYHGRPCLLVFFHDVTDRRKAEERLKREQQALRRMVLATDHERRLITYELHDGVAQQLLGAKMLFESQQRPKRRKAKESGDAYHDGMEALNQATSELRRVMNRLRTPVLDRFGLVEAIKDVASQLRSTPGAPEIECNHDVQFERLEPTLENSLFRIAQEAMTNACRHSQGEKVRVTLTQEGDEVTLEVQDWGIGFAPDAVVENHFGLEGIRERSRILGGKLSVKSEPGQGTVVRVTFPVIEAADPD